MSHEGFNRPEAEKLLPIGDGKLQARLAEFSFQTEHPDEPAADHRRIMNVWIEDHAADWRKVIDAHEGETVAPKDLNDPAVLRTFYEEMLHRHDDEQTRH